MRTIVAELQPAILATLAMGILAFSILDTAVCLRSWKRQTSAGGSSSDTTPSEIPVRIFQALTFAASHASLNLNE